MPEGDVVLRTARRLTQALADGVLVAAELRWPNLAGTDLTGVHSLGTVAYGKNLLTRFSDGRTLHTHLRMDGTWNVSRTRPDLLGRSSGAAARPGGAAPGGHGPGRGSDVRAVLATATWTCTGHQLGMMHLLRTRDEPRLLAPLGPDVLAETYDVVVQEQIAAAIIAQDRRAIGAVLLDQHVLAGLGTIYMAETLFRHRISPWRPARDVEDPGELAATARRLMQGSADAAVAPGTRGSVPIVVHGRLGQPCVRCSNPVRVAQVGEAPFDRPAFHCPTCQSR